MATINIEAAGVNGLRICGLTITTGGDPFTVPIKALVKHNRWYQANTFQVKIGLYHDPDHNIAWWGDNARVDDFPMEITYTVDGTDKLMMAGQVDKISLDIRKGEVTCHGRDNASYLIDTMTRETFTDQTVASIVNDLAGRVGLNVDLDDGHEDVSTLVREGHYILNIGSSFGHAVSYWDLLAWMAKTFNYYIYVDGDTLYFHRQDHDADVWQVILTPPTDDQDPVETLNPSNAQNIIFDRDLNVARNTSVVVQSYDAQLGPDNGKIAETDDQSKLRGGIKSQTMQYVVPGLTAAQANSMANAIYNNTVRHEKKFSWTEPGDQFLSCLEQAEVTGGDTGWHQKYFIESIERTMDRRGGFTMHCSGTNADPAIANTLTNY